MAYVHVYYGSLCVAVPAKSFAHVAGLFSFAPVDRRFCPYMDRNDTRAWFGRSLSDVQALAALPGSFVVRRSEMNALDGATVQ